MPSQEIKEYYDATEYREVCSDLTFAVNIVGDPKIAIDCGCVAKIRVREQLFLILENIALLPGLFVAEVRITGSDEHDLTGMVAS